MNRSIRALTLTMMFALAVRFVSAQATSIEPTKAGPANEADSKTDLSDLYDSKNPPLDPKKLEAPLAKNLFIELSKLINPAVVSISTTQNVKMRRGGYRDPMQEFLEEFMGGGRGGFAPAQPVQALGTGFIIRPNGLIITNNHVIEQADIIKVQLDNASNVFYEAKVVGRDQRTDVALIKIDAKKALPVAPLGTSKDLQVGEWVAAFGNPYGHAHTMTKGIVSAIGREIGEINKFPFIQTDASINPGNSGGPLVNTQGFVIGVNTAIDARAQGIGFAIPIDNVKSIISELERNGRVKRGYVGIGLGVLSPEIAASLGLEDAEGVVVTQVINGGPAAAAGLQKYDIIVEFGPKKIQTPSDLQNAVADTTIGSKAKVKIIRLNNDHATNKSLEVTVRENPEDTKIKKDAPKHYFGQKAPFDLGFRVADDSKKLREEFSIEGDAPKKPVVIDVEAASIAARSGLHSGDVIIDVNRKSVNQATDVVKNLKQGKNIVSVARGQNVILVPLDTALR